MLLRLDGDDVLVIGQASHAWLSGQLARAWGNDQFPPPSPREEVCLAALQHDVGMAEWDLRPTLNRATGWPHSFMEMPLELRLSLWTAAPLKVLSQSRYAALLVSMHGTALYARLDRSRFPTKDDERITRYLTGQRQLQATLTEQLALDPEQRDRNQRLIWAWDLISLAVCLPWPELTAQNVPTTDGSIDLEITPTATGRFQLDPWPLRTGALEVQTEARRLTGHFDDVAALHHALDRAVVERLTFTVHR